MRPYHVGIAGATGLVGQHLIGRLADHPWFRIEALGASERSAGRPYAEAVRWVQSRPIPEALSSRPVGRCEPEAFAGCDFVLSALDAPVARTLEPALADAGIAVVSNSSAFRMDPAVPLLIPEVNGRHVARLTGRERSGFIVTNPNCSVTGLALALAPLHRAFGVVKVVVATMQSISGAGIEGPRAIEIMDNVVPYIPGEEEKIEAELAKLLGEAGPDRFVPAPMRVSAHCHRVPTLDGHLEAVSVELARPATPDEATLAMEAFTGDIEGAALPSAPGRPVRVRREPDRPQTRLDRDDAGGMRAVVGRVRPCPVATLRFVVLSHNMVRGAAGGTLLNAEWLASQDLLPRRSRG
ncbi:MAG TPA: aspartate-semialdehyde dehydrogenase [Candidatus Polarisedimenticolaceae bacterium]|nr:aspartate-semialdehyde dehydrogenase [Candidatus Polarisedimenticolaceae bacterium]